MKRLKKHFSTFVIVLFGILGLSLLLYPTVSEWWNAYHQSEAIANYTEEVNKLDEADYKRMLQEAQEYNQRLSERKISWVMTKDEEKEYESLLDVSGTGIMGYIEIPKIHCRLPIYHGIDDTTLQIAIGHLKETSLPVGGEASHCVLSGHRGLASAKLFTNLNELVVGDQFELHVLDNTYTYEVDQIRIVLPNELGDLQIEDGKDYCTLVTCTPYKVNTHRLLVRGHRIDRAIDISVQADAIQIDSVTLAFVIVILLLILWVVLLVWKDFIREEGDGDE